MALTAKQLAAVEILRKSMSSEDWESMRLSLAQASGVIVQYAAIKISELQIDNTVLQTKLTAITNSIASNAAFVSALEDGVKDSNAYLANHPTH